MNFLNGSIHHQDPQRKDENALGVRPSVSCEQSRGIQCRGANLIGSGLTDADYAALESRWIDRSLVTRAQLRRVDSLTGTEVLGRKSGDYAGLLIPYFLPESNQVREYRLRRDHPDLEYDFAGNLKVRQKYLSAPGRTNMLYLPPGVSHSLLRESVLLIVLTEGEFKTLALWRVANHGAPSCPRFLPVGVSGVYNWRGTIGKTVGPDGSRLDVKGAIPDLDWLAWAGRRVIIAYLPLSDRWEYAYCSRYRISPAKQSSFQGVTPWMLLWTPP